MFSHGFGPILFGCCQLLGAVSFFAVAVTFIATTIALVTATYLQWQAFGRPLHLGLYWLTRWSVRKGIVFLVPILCVFSMIVASGLGQTWISQELHHATSTQAVVSTQASVEAAVPKSAPLSRSKSPHVEPGPLRPRSITASSTAPNGTDGSGKSVSFSAANLDDGHLNTAWRTQGDGDLARIVIMFARPVHVTSLGLIPGYAKVDPVSHVDRFTENRRIKSVVWTSPTNKIADQTFDNDPTMQRIRVSVITTEIILTVTGTTRPGARDFTAISEIQILGYAVT